MDIQPQAEARDEAPLCPFTIPMFAERIHEPSEALAEAQDQYSLGLGREAGTSAASRRGATRAPELAI